MKPLRILFTAALVTTATALFAQVQIDKPIQLTGGAGQRVITNLELPVNGTDAANKDYVDAAVAASGGSVSTATMMSDESSFATYYFQGLVYCDTLTEGGYTDWYMPSVADFEKLVRDGFSFPSPGSTNYFFLTHPNGNPASPLAMGRVSPILGNSTTYVASNRIRCVRD